MDAPRLTIEVYDLVPAYANKGLHATAQGQQSARQRLFNWMEWDFSRVEGAGYRQQQQRKRKADCKEGATFMMLLLIPQVEKWFRQIRSVRARNGRSGFIFSDESMLRFLSSVRVRWHTRLSLKPPALVSTSQAAST